LGRLGSARRRYLLRVVLALALLGLLLGHALGAYRLTFIERLEVRTYDLRLLATAEFDPETPVVIVDIDEASLGAVGRWPWPRHIVAELVRELLDRQGAALVAFDVVFAEPDLSSGLPVLEALAEGPLREQDGFRQALDGLRGSLDRDALLAATLAGRPVLLGYYFNSGREAVRSGRLPAPVFLADDFAGRGVPLIRADGYGANIEILQDAALGAGHFTPLFDRDGVSRRAPLLIEFEGAVYETLALAVARHFLGGVPPRLVFGATEESGYQALEAIRVADRRIPVDAQATSLIPYPGPRGTFRYIPAAQVLDGSLPESSLENRIVLIGTSAPGLMDLRSTPVGSAYPGVEIHASLIQGILSDQILHRPAYLLGFEVLALALLGGALALLLPVLGPAAAMLTAGIGLAGVIALGLYLWEAHLMVMPMATLLAAVSGLYLLDTVYALFVESRARARIAILFGQYVPPRVVEALAENPDLASMSGESREMTVLFSDVRNFTSVSEGLSAAALAALMNDYLSTMTQAIQAEDGTIDKYIGDAIMAFWGAPLRCPDHALGAVRAALTMQEAAAGLRQTYTDRGWPPLHIGIGINTGTMNVGNMGSEFRRAYTVLGDAVNLASRLEGLTKYYGVGILVSEYTHAATRDDILYRELDRIQVKGREEPVAIFEPMRAGQGPGQDPPPGVQVRVARYAEMLAAYRARDWHGAMNALQDLEHAGDSPTLLRLFRERIELLRSSPPPPGWDGVYRFQEK
jgi:adenylate cyclase